MEKVLDKFFAIRLGTYMETRCQFDFRKKLFSNDTLNKKLEYVAELKRQKKYTYLGHDAFDTKNPFNSVRAHTFFTSW